MVTINNLMGSFFSQNVRSKVTKLDLKSQWSQMWLTQIVTLEKCGWKNERKWKKTWYYNLSNLSRTSINFILTVMRWSNKPHPGIKPHRFNFHSSTQSFANCYNVTKREVGKFFCCEAQTRSRESPASDLCSSQRGFRTLFEGFLASNLHPLTCRGIVSQIGQILCLCLCL